VFAYSLRIPRPGPAGKVTDQELIALAVAQTITGLCSDRQFLGAIGRLLPGFFPALPTQTRYNRRLRRLTPQIAAGQLMVALHRGPRAAGRRHADRVPQLPGLRI
jgi:hypothetical protein